MNVQHPHEAAPRQPPSVQQAKEAQPTGPAAAGGTWPANCCEPSAPVGQQPSQQTNTDPLKKLTSQLQDSLRHEKVNNAVETNLQKSIAAIRTNLDQFKKEGQKLFDDWTAMLNQVNDKLQRAAANLGGHIKQVDGAIAIVHGNTVFDLRRAFQPLATAHGGAAPAPPAPAGTT